MRILVVEDDRDVARILKLLLSSHCYAVDVAIDGATGWQMVEAFEYDLVILDVLLPKLDGVSFCQQLRAQGYTMPVLLLTGLNGSHEKVAALNAGADDYVVKPFDQEELIARVQALLRRSSTTVQPVLSCGTLRMDPSRRSVIYGDHNLHLTPKEYALLELLLHHGQRVLSAETMLEHAWTSEEAPGQEAVRVHIKGLRQKLKQAGAPADLIETMYGAGYRLNPEAIVAPGTPEPSNQPPLPNSVAVAKPVCPLVSLPDPLPQRVMLVTQDCRLLAFLQELLEARNVQVTAVLDSQQLWQCLETCAPHLLVLDVDLSPVDGIELGQAVRQHPRWQGLPILSLTANTNIDLIQQIFAAGADDFVSKPIVGPEFITRVLSRL
jgi:DNA-binding response OmpR family regulator